MLNTFFFGYLSLKWRRLFRTFSILVFIAIPFYFMKTPFFHPDTVSIMLAFLICIAIISYVAKPFITKENK